MMKRNLTLVAALLLGSTALSAPAIAKDDMGAKAGQSADAEIHMNQGNATAPGLSGSAGANADVDAQVQGDAYDPDMGTTADADSDLDADLGDVDTTASTNAGANASYGAVISSLRSGSTNATQIEGMSEVSSVNVVRIDSLTGEGDPQSLENAINDNQDQVSELQNAIDANSALKSELDAQSVATSDIVATDIGADGTVTVYTR